jgi:hypothetical protein
LLRPEMPLPLNLHCVGGRDRMHGFSVVQHPVTLARPATGAELSTPGSLEALARAVIALAIMWRLERCRTRGRYWQPPVSADPHHKQAPVAHT